MKKLSILFSLLFISIFCSSQTQTIQVTGPSATSGPVTITLEINPPPASCTVSVIPQIVSLNTGASIQFNATTNCSPATLTWDVNGTVGGNSAIGTVSVSGLYTAPAFTPVPSTVTVNVTSVADITKKASAAITITTSGTTGNDSKCSPTGVPNFGGIDSATVGGITVNVNTPQSCFNTNPAITSPSGAVHTITQANFATVIPTVPCGDIIEIAQGTTITGTITIGKPCPPNAWLQLRTSGWASLPPYGTKISPCYNGVASLPGRPNFNCPIVSNVMATIQSTGVASPIVYNANTTNFRMDGIVLTRNSGTGQIGNMINSSAGGINHIIYEHIWGRGVPTDDINTFLSLDKTSFVAMKDSFISDVHCTSVIGACTDSKAVGGGTNSSVTDHDNTYSIVNNYLESSGQCGILGGGTTTNNITDFEFRSNYCLKPAIWNPSDPSYNGGNSGHPYIVKNCFELKTGIRIFIEGNYFEGSWAGFSQVGNCFTVKPANQAGGGGSNICPLCQVKEVVFRYNKMALVAEPYQIINIPSDNGGFAAGGDHYAIHDNQTDNEHNTASNGGSTSPDMTMWESGNVPSNDVLQYVNFSHNSIIRVSGGSTPGNMALITGASFASGNNVNHIIYANNVLPYGQFNAFTNAGNGTTSCDHGQTDAYLNTNVTPNKPGVIDSCWSSYAVAGNAFINNRSTIVWPVGNCTTLTTYTAMFTNYNGGINGDYHINAPCHNTATDGRDPGPDLTKLNSLTSGVNSF